MSTYSVADIRGRMHKNGMMAEGRYDAGMSQRVYVDGESHFIRSETDWKNEHGDDALLGEARTSTPGSPDQVLFIPEAKVFWMRLWGPAVYFTSMVGDERQMYDVKVRMREFDLEPRIVPERGDLAKRRANRLRDAHIIEKAKGVDAALSVRVLEDAYRDLFRDVMLYTSDVDVLPVIEAVQRLGKRVYIWGYESGLAKESPLRHVPERFWSIKVKDFGREKVKE